MCSSCVVFRYCCFLVLLLFVVCVALVVIVVVILCSFLYPIIALASQFRFVFPFVCCSLPLHVVLFCPFAFIGIVVPVRLLWAFVLLLMFSFIVWVVVLSPLGVAHSVSFVALDVLVFLLAIRALILLVGLVVLVVLGSLVATVAFIVVPSSSLRLC